MLCDRCQHHETCFLPQLAAHDTYTQYRGDRGMTPKAAQPIQTLLDKLQVCELYVARFPQGFSWANEVNKLRHASRIGLRAATARIRHLLKGHCLTE